MPRKREGKEVKQQVSVRVQPSDYLKAVKKYGSFSAFVKEAILKLLK